MNRRKSHADENFTWTGFRFRQFSYGEDVVGFAGAFKNECFHKCSPYLFDAAYQLRETRFAESLLDGVVRSVEDGAKPSFHRAGHHAFLMHLAAHRKNSALAFNRLVDLTERYARCSVSETDATVATLAKRDESLSLEELEDLPHHDRVGPEAFRDCLRSRPLVAGASDEGHDVDGARETSVRGHKQSCNSYSCAVKLQSADRARRAAAV